MQIDLRNYSVMYLIAGAAEAYAEGHARRLYLSDKFFLLDIHRKAGDS